MKRKTSKLVSALLALCLALALLPGTALATDVGPSPQKLMVDGKPVDCERYDIDGHNYFKLRDLAYALNGTGSQFRVDYDADSNTAIVTSRPPARLDAGSFFAAYMGSSYYKNL